MTTYAELITQLYRKLKDLEWYDEVPLSDGYPVGCCPDCGNVEYMRHKDDCELRAVLAEYEELISGGIEHKDNCRWIGGSADGPIRCLCGAYEERGGTDSTPGTATNIVGIMYEPGTLGEE